MTETERAVLWLKNNSEKLNLEWVNTNRISDDWKAYIYAHKITKRQIAIYDREKLLLVVLEDFNFDIEGYSKYKKPKSDALKHSLSRLEGNKGICLKLDTVETFKKLLSLYYGKTLHSSTVEEIAFKPTKPPVDLKADRKIRLANASKKPETRIVTAVEFIRNQDVVAEVLERANGICEKCYNKAPFLRKSDNSPYLEVHHKIRLADDGDDTVENAIALCPNCHREAHYG
jgi:hypothetical protein